MKAKAEQLFDVIGGIDERYVQNAFTYRRRRIGLFKPISVAAAVLIVLCAVFYSFFNLGGTEPTQKTDVFEKTLVSIQANVKPENINLFDGITKLIWSYGDDVYYSVEIKGSYDSGNLFRYMTTSSINTGGKEKSDIRFWVNFGDGTVMTPYLTRSGGNIGYGTLFDYEPERALSDNFAAYLKNLIDKYIDF